MGICKRIQYYVSNPEQRRAKLLKIYGNLLSDEKYLKKLYKVKIGRTLDLKNPKTYTEKIQWLKLHDRNPQYTMMQDKYASREFIKKTIGEEYLIPLLGVWNDANEIDFKELPDQFVLKCNHDCASVVICRDKKKLDIEQVKEKLNKCLKRNYYKEGLEWTYKDITPCIIAEKYMANENEKTLTDYKFFCCSGKAKFVMLTFGEAHTKERRLDFFDMSFNPLPIKRGAMTSSNRMINKPKEFDVLVGLAEKIAENIPFIRVDFYLVNGHPYFGEVAFYPDSGLTEFSPYEWEERIGSWIQLPCVENMIDSVD